MTYWSRNSWISVGLGSSSSLTSPASASSSSMMSLHRSMHSSQMYTPGPAISFLTCFCDFPQNEHLTRSLDSPNLATTPLPPGPSGHARSLRDYGQFSCGDHFVNDSVYLGLSGAHDEIAVGVGSHLVDRLAGVGGQHLVEKVPHAQDLLG